jgi:hypothetical protein
MSGASFRAGSVGASVPAWTAHAAVVAGEQRRAPDSSLIVSGTTRITGAVYDAIEAPHWQVAVVDVSDLEAAVADLQDLTDTFDTGKQDVSEKGQPGGYAALNNSGKVVNADGTEPTGTGGGSGAGGIAGAQITAAVDGTSGDLVATLVSPFGISASTGIPYYDPAGATAVEAAWPAVDASGNLVITQLLGGTA